MFFKEYIIFFRNLKETYLQSTPLEKWKFVSRASVLILQYIGCHITHPNYKLTIFALVPGIILSIYFSLSIYTCYYYRASVLLAIQPFCILGAIVPVRYFFVI